MTLPIERDAECCAASCPLPGHCGPSGPCYVVTDARQRGLPVRLHEGAVVIHLDAARRVRAAHAQEDSR